MDKKSLHVQKHVNVFDLPQRLQSNFLQKCQIIWVIFYKDLILTSRREANMLERDPFYNFDAGS